MKSIRSIRNFINDEGGQDIVEYSLLLVLLAVAAMTVLTGLGQSVNSLFTSISEKLDAVSAKAD